MRVACIKSSVFNIRATGLLHLAQAQNVHATVELAEHRSSVFNATFVPDGSDERQQSGRRVVGQGRWTSGRCGGLKRKLC